MEEPQNGFRKGRSTQDSIFMPRQKSEKAFDRIRKNVVWKCMSNVVKSQPNARKSGIKTGLSN